MFTVGIITSQQTPSQIVSAGSAFYRFSPMDLEVAKSTLLSQIVYGAVVNPSSIISNGAAFYGLDYQGHQVAQTYLLSLIQANFSTNGGAFVLSLNGAATNVALWNKVNFNANLTATPYWVSFWTDTHFFLTNVDNGGSLHLGASGQLSTTGGFLGDGSALTNIVLSPWTTDINGAGKSLTNANVIVVTNILATNGIASFSTLAAISIAATGWTNIWATNNATVYITSTAVAWTIKNRANSTIYTSPTLSATVSVHLQPGWSVNAASGLAGTALPD